MRGSNRFELKRMDPPHFPLAFIMCDSYIIYNSNPRLFVKSKVVRSKACAVLNFPPLPGMTYPLSASPPFL